MGEMDECQRSKFSTEFAIVVSGYKRVLTGATYSDRNIQMNQVVYSQIAVTTVVGTAHHLIKQHEDDKNGYGSWNDLCEWYDGYAVKNKTADNLRFKLEI